MSASISLYHGARRVLIHLTGADEGEFQVIAESVDVLEGWGMVSEQLEPRLELLREEYVLVQA